MYTSFYGLREKPFSLLPDPDYLYLSRQHRMALELLEYSLINQAGFCVITGEVGAGKTTLIRCLMTKVDERITIGLLRNVGNDYSELLRWVLMAFGLNCNNKTKVEMQAIFTDYIIDQYAKKRRTVLIVDEAQHMQVEALEELRMLSNINADKDQVVQVILAGQNELRDTLRQPSMAQFAQRVVVDYHLGPLNLKETRAYIHHRIQVAGGRCGLFHDQACADVYEFSGGIPRLINLLCDMAMVYGYAETSRIITRQQVQEVVREHDHGDVLPTYRWLAAAASNRQTLLEQKPAPAPRKRIPYIPERRKDWAEPTAESALSAAATSTSNTATHAHSGAAAMRKPVMQPPPPRPRPKLSNVPKTAKQFATTPLAQPEPEPRPEPRAQQSSNEPPTLTDAIPSNLDGTIFAPPSEDFAQVQMYQGTATDPYPETDYPKASHTPTANQTDPTTARLFSALNAAVGMQAAKKPLHTPAADKPIEVPKETASRIDFPFDLPFPQARWRRTGALIALSIVILLGLYYFFQGQAAVVDKTSQSSHAPVDESVADNTTASTAVPVTQTEQQHRPDLASASNQEGLAPREQLTNPASAMPTAAPQTVSEHAATVQAAPVGAQPTFEQSTTPAVFNEQEDLAQGMPAASTTPTTQDSEPSAIEQTTDASSLPQATPVAVETDTASQAPDARPQAASHNASPKALQREQRAKAAQEQALREAAAAEQAAALRAEQATRERERQAAREQAEMAAAAQAALAAQTRATQIQIDNPTPVNTSSEGFNPDPCTGIKARYMSTCK